MSTMPDVSFHVLLVAILACSLFVIAKRRASVAAVVAASIGLTLLVACSGAPVFLSDEAPLFATAQLVAWWCFVYGPLGLIGLGIVARESPRLRVASLLLAFTLLAIGVDAFVVEPTALAVRHERIVAAVPRAIRIVVLADVQTDHVGAYEREVFARVRALRPDVLLYPGDYVQAGGAHYDREARALARLAGGVRPPLGAFAVRGNVEFDRWRSAVFEGTGVQAFETTATVTSGPLSITALSFDDSFDPRLQVPAAPGFHIVVGHAPDFSLGNIAADLLVAGHTHGGQVQLPFVGPLITLSRVARTVAAGGLFTLSAGRQLLVSRGIGMERAAAPRLRFRCPPEIVVVDLVPAVR